jgi:hypothetical protein
MSTFAYVVTKKRSMNIVMSTLNEIVLFFHSEAINNLRNEIFVFDLSNRGEKDYLSVNMLLLIFKGNKFLIMKTPF